MQQDVKSFRPLAGLNYNFWGAPVSVYHTEVSVPLRG